MTLQHSDPVLLPADRVVQLQSNRGITEAIQLSVQILRAELAAMLHQLLQCAVGTCMEEASRTFDMDDEAVAFVSNPNGNSDEEILAAAKSCPVDAIFLFQKETGERVWPPREKRFERPDNPT